MDSIDNAPAVMLSAAVEVVRLTSVVLPGNLPEP